MLKEEKTVLGHARDSYDTYMPMRPHNSHPIAVLMDFSLTTVSERCSSSCENRMPYFGVVMETEVYCEDGEITLASAAARGQISCAQLVGWTHPPTQISPLTAECPYCSDRIDSDTPPVICHASLVSPMYFREIPTWIIKGETMRPPSPQ